MLVVKFEDHPLTSQSMRNGPFLFVYMYDCRYVCKYVWHICAHTYVCTCVLFPIDKKVKNAIP